MKARHPRNAARSSGLARIHSVSLFPTLSPGPVTWSPTKVQRLSISLMGSWAGTLVRNRLVKLRSRFCLESRPENLSTGEPFGRGSQVCPEHVGKRQVETKKPGPQSLISQSQRHQIPLGRGQRPERGPSAPFRPRHYRPNCSPFPVQ